MKCYRKLVIDIATGQRIYEDSFDYDGPVCQVKGSQKSTTTITVPPPTAEEEQDKALGRGLNLLNLQESGYDSVYDPETKQYTFTKRPLTPEQQKEEDQLNKLREIAYNRMAGVADPETRRLVAETYQGQRDAGNAELQRYMGEQAAARGLNINDTPFLREEGLRKAQLETGLRGAEAGSLLDVGSREQQFGLALADFRNSLQQQAFLNRQSLGESALQSGLGLGRMRMGQTTTTSKLSSSGGGFNFGSAIGGGLSGALAGSKSGPWGALGGGLVGFGLGGLQGSGQG